ncbi:MAG: DNA methyltransferase [Bacteroidota bacterium]
MKLSTNTIFQEDVLVLFERIRNNYFHTIYLDPPWNMSQVFFYQADDVSLIEYQDFLFKVFQQSYRCLKPDGNLWLFAPTSTETNYSLLLEKVFGRENLRMEFVLPRKMYIGHQTIGKNHDTLFLFSKNADAPIYPVKVKLSPEEIERRYQYEDKKGRYRLDSLFTRPNSISFSYSWKGFNPPEQLGWRFSLDRLEELNSQGLISFDSKDNYPRLKRHFRIDALPNIGSVWDDIEINDRQNQKSSPGAQSLELFNRIIELSTQEGDWILDPFAGSGALLVEASKLKRNWIGNDSSEYALQFIRNRLSRESIESQEYEIGNSDPIYWDDYESLIQTEQEKIKKILNEGENHRVEFKAYYLWNIYTDEKDGEMPNQILKEICAFMNSRVGGTLFIGVQDKDGKLLGLNKDFKAVDKGKRNSDAYRNRLTTDIRTKLGSNAISKFVSEVTHEKS